MISKNKLLYNEVIIKYLPAYKVVDFEDLKVERIIEKLIAEVGNLTWVGDKNLSYDYACDLSDAKTCTLKSRGKYGYAGVITSTETKPGALRVVIANTITETVEYFYIPNDAIKELERAVGGQKYALKRCIRFSWSKRKQAYSKIEPFRCNSFEEMCQKS